MKQLHAKKLVSQLLENEKSILNSLNSTTTKKSMNQNTGYLKRKSKHLEDTASSTRSRSLLTEVSLGY